MSAIISNPDFDRRMAALVNSKAFAKEPGPVQLQFRKVIVNYSSYAETPSGWQKFIDRIEKAS